MNNSFDLLKKLKLATGHYRKVNFNDPLRAEPVSRLFGLDRGQPIDRYYIEKFLESNREFIKGNVLEVAEDRYSRMFADPAGQPVFHILHVEEGNTPGRLRGDLTRPGTLPESQYACFICTQTFNFIFEVQQAVEGAYRLLKPGGILLATVAGISQISAYDRDRWGDYWRFTAQSAEKLFFRVFGKDNVELKVYGNLPAAKTLLEGLAVEDLPDPALLDHPDPEYPVIIGIVAKKN